MARKYKFGRRKARKYARLRRIGVARMARRLRPALPVTHKFKETCVWSGGPLHAPTNSVSNGIMTFVFNDLNNIVSYRGLFDLYKITGVKVRIVPRWSSGDVLASQLGQAGFPMLYVAENRDPYVPAPTSLGDILNDDGVKIIRLNKPITMFLKNPKAEIKDVSGNSLPFQFNSSSKSLQPWLTTGGNSQSVDQSTVNHYGFRYWLDNTLCGSPINIDVFTTYYFSMKEQN